MVERGHNPEISALILLALILSTDLGLEADIFGPISKNVQTFLLKTKAVTEQLSYVHTARYL